MDALVSIAVEEIALEGQEGCTVETLWTLLGSRLPVGSITCLPPQLQDMVWELLVERTEDIQLFTLPAPNAPGEATEGPEDAGVKKSKGARIKKKVENNPMAKMIQVPPDDPRVRTHKTVAEHNIRLAASEAVRLSVLGVYEIQDSRFPLSDSQLAALAVVGRTRWRGTINADLANRLGIAYRNFYYIIKNLETRKLVVKNPVVFAPPGATVTVSSVLHLPRFQPAVKLGPGQMFKTVDAVRGMEVATYVLQDDNVYMRLVCSTIAETAERVVVESDLKIVCGFRGTRGHRLWRRLRKKMGEQGYLAFETCRVRDRLVPCVRLLKDWKPPAADDVEVAGEDGEDGDADEGAGGERGGTIHVTELSLERQLLEGILSAGPDGVLNHELFSKLGVSSKVYGTKLVEIIKRYNLQVTVVNRGRTVLNRLVAPPELLAAAGHLLPLPAAGTAAAAVGAATEALEAPEAAATIATAVAREAGPSGAGPSTADAAEAAAALVAAAGLASAGKPRGKAAAKPKGKAVATKGKAGKAKAAAEAEAAVESPAGRPRRSAAVKASAGAAAALKELGGDGGGDSDDYDVAEGEDREVHACGSSSEGIEVEDEEGQIGSEAPSEKLEAEEAAEEQQRRRGGGRGSAAAGRSAGVGAAGRGRGRGRPPKRPRLNEAAAVAAMPSLPPAVAVPILTAAKATNPAPAAAGAAATSGGGTNAAAGAKERKPHWTKVITLKTEDRLRLLVEHLNQHRFIPRVQVRRLVMEWESAASGKPIPNSLAGPDIKTIRRLMERLAESGKAKLIRVETRGFLGDNRPIDTLLRPDLEATPELLDEIRKQMAHFERRLRSECCKKAMAARKMATTTDYPIGNLLPEAVVTAAAAAGSASAAAAVAAAAVAAANAGGGGGAPPEAQADGLDEATDGLLRAAGLHPADHHDPAVAAGAAAGGARGSAGSERRLGGRALSPQTAANMRIGRGVSLFRAVHNEATARSVENGLIPAKMVRVRLLHFLIAKLVGLGGFEADPLASVDPDPGGMPNMPLSLGEEVLSLASATERSRMAFAFGAMKGAAAAANAAALQQPPAGDLQQQKQPPQGEAGGGAAAAGAEAEAGGVGGDASQGGGGAGAGAGADSLAQLRHLSVRRLWSIMPLSVALQVLGSTCRRPPDELARLCESGATLGSLTPELGRSIMDGTSVHRLEYLISILRRLRLLEWAVVDHTRLDATRRPGPGAGVRARDGQGVRLLVHVRGVLEIPPGKELSPIPPANGATAAAPGGADGAAPAAGGGGATSSVGAGVIVMAPSGFTALTGGSGRFVEVDLASAAGLDEYWRRFEELYRLSGSAHTEVQRLRRCFPATTVPEVLSRNSWYGQRLMTAAQWLRLQAGLDQIDLADGLQITTLAAQLGIDVDVVARIVSDRRRRLNRLGDPDAAGSSGDEEGAGRSGGVPLRLARLNPGAAMRSRGGGGAGPGGAAATAAGEADGALPAGERRRMMKRRTVRRSSPGSRQRRAVEREAEACAKAARKQARATKRAEKEAAKAERRAARAAGTYVVRRRTRAELEAADAEAEAAGLPSRKRRRASATQGGREQQRGGQQSAPPAHPTARDISLAAVGSGRERLLLAPFVPPAGVAAAADHHQHRHRARRSSDDRDEALRSGDDGQESGGGGGADGGPRVHMPSTAAPSRVTRILWTVSEDRALLAEYVRMAADTGPNVRLPWRSGASVLPYSIPVCLRHIRYLKRNYPSYTGRLDELLRRAHDRKVAMARLVERGEARVAAYRERLRRRRAGEAVRPLDAEGYEEPEESARGASGAARDPVEMTRAIVVKEIAAAAAAAEKEGGGGSGLGLEEEALAAAEGFGRGEGVEGVEALRAAEAVRLEPGELPAEAAVLQAAAAREEQQAATMASEREAAIAEALSLVEDFVLVIPRRSSQKRRELLQQQGGLELGERLDQAHHTHHTQPSQSAEAAARRRAAIAARRSLGGVLQSPPPSAAAATAAAGASVAGASDAGATSGGGGGVAAAAVMAAVPLRIRRPIVGPTGAAPVPLKNLAPVAPPPPPLARPSVAVTAAMCMLVSLLLKVRAMGGVTGWMSNQVVETLADFGRRFAADIKAAALKQMQLRGWLAPSGPRRQLDLTPAFVNRLHGTELPLGLLGRCASAAGRLDELLAKAMAAAARCAARGLHDGHDEEEEGRDVDGGATTAAAVGDRAGAEAVERSCGVDAAAGALTLEAAEQLPSELVALVLARQALGMVELLPGAVGAQPEWAGQAATAGVLLTSVQLLIVPAATTTVQDAAAAVAVAGRGGGGGRGFMGLPASPPPVAGTPVVATAGGFFPHASGDGGDGRAASSRDSAATDTRHAHPRSATAAGHTQAQHHDRPSGREHRDHGYNHNHRREGDGAGPWPGGVGGLPACGTPPVFAPSAVASDPATRAAAMAACKAHLAGQAPSCPAIVEELTEVAEALLDAGGPDGLTFSELKVKLHKAAGPGADVATATTAAPAEPDGSSGGEAAAATATAPAESDGGGGGEAAAVAAPLPPAVSLSVPPSEYLVSVVVRALQLHGLVRTVGGWDALHFIAAQHCRDAIVEVDAAAGAAADAADGAVTAAAEAVAAPPAEAAAAGPTEPPAAGAADAEAGATLAATAAEAMDTDAAAATGTATAQQEGSTAAAARAPVAAPATADAAAAAAGRERVLRPWLDHRGTVNCRVWDALLQRLLGLAMRHPGITEDMLVAALDIIPPQAVRELLRHLAAHGRLEVRTTPAPPSQHQRSRRPLLLGGGGAGRRSAAPPPPPVVHYFPVLEHHAGASMLQVPPP